MSSTRMIVKLIDLLFLFGSLASIHKRKCIYACELKIVHFPTSCLFLIIWFPRHSSLKVETRGYVSSARGIQNNRPELYRRGLTLMWYSWRLRQKNAWMLITHTHGYNLYLHSPTLWQDMVVCAWQTNRKSIIFKLLREIFQSHRASTRRH